MRSFFLYFQGGGGGGGGMGSYSRRVLWITQFSIFEWVHIVSQLIEFGLLNAAEPALLLYVPPVSERFAQRGY